MFLTLMADIYSEVRTSRLEVLIVFETRQSIINVAQGLLQVNKEHMHTDYALHCAINATTRRPMRSSLVTRVQDKPMK
jgi:hypothetical protein